jgi:hypothetical protein
VLVRSKQGKERCLLGRMMKKKRWKFCQNQVLPVTHRGTVQQVLWIAKTLSEEESMLDGIHSFGRKVALQPRLKNTSSARSA